MVNWLPVKKFEGFYSISDTGLVMSERSGKLLKPSISNVGYYRIMLSLAGATLRTHIHRLVAEAFIPNPDRKPCVNHKDANKLNNNVENLEWVTYRENTMHAYNLGLFPRIGGGHWKTHCKRGHEFTPENLYVYPGRRGCKECIRLRDLERSKQRSKLKDMLGGKVI